MLVWFVATKRPTKTSNSRFAMEPMESANNWFNLLLNYCEFWCDSLCNIQRVTKSIRFLFFVGTISRKDTPNPFHRKDFLSCGHEHNRCFAKQHGYAKEPHGINHFFFQHRCTIKLQTFSPDSPKTNHLFVVRCWKKKPRWWFQIFFIFIPIWGRFPFWLIFFKWVETTN